MIRPDQKITTEAEVAAELGIPTSTWDRRDAAVFRAMVPPLFAGRVRVYDLTAAQDYIGRRRQGRPLVPPADDSKDARHSAVPDDVLGGMLLDAAEAGAVLGVEAKQVHHLAARGYLPPAQTLTTDQGTPTAVRVWPGSAIIQRRDNPPGRGTGGGYPAGVPRPEQRKDRPYQDDPRLDTARQALAAGPGRPAAALAAELAGRHGGSTRTWERLLAAART